MTSSEIAKYLFEQLIAAGTTRAGACAVLGNVQAESGFVPNNLENAYNIRLGMSDEQYTAAVDNGTYTNFVYDGCGYGLPQWTFWSRKDGFLKYVKSRGKSIGDVYVQVEYLIKEFKDHYTAIWNQLKSSEDLYALTWVLLDKWENPAVKNISTRYQYAQNWYKTFQTSTTTTTTTGGSVQMTEAQAIEKVLNLARNEIGYKEKRSNAQLDDKTANAGGGNWTKYARDLDAVTNFYNGAKNGFAWCDIWVDWLFYHLFGATAAMNMLCQPERSSGAGCLQSANYYKRNNRWTNKPAPGHQIFFATGGDVYHTGIVEQVTGNQVITIEGNTSDQVARRTYAIGDGRIYGYGIPRWSYATGSGSTTPSTPAPSTPVSTALRYGSKGEEVKKLQQNLMKLGYSLPLYGADGDFGNETLAAVKKFQKDNNLAQDGVVGSETKAAIEKKLNSSQAAVPSTSTKTYTVKKGDTLWAIAQKYLGSGARYPEIKKLNGLTSDLIKPGQVLKLP